MSGAWQLSTKAGERNNQRLPDQLVWCLVAVSVLPFALSLAGVEFARIEQLHIWLLGSFLHNLLEWTAVCLAVPTALIAFIQFGLTKTTLTPFIGAALFWSGCVDAFHTLATDHFIRRVTDVERFIPITWTASRVFSCIVLLVGAGVVLIRKPEPGRRDRTLLFGTIGFFGVASYLLVAYCANSGHLPRCLFPGRLIVRPYDLIPVVLYLLVGYPLFRRLNRRTPKI